MIKKNTIGVVIVCYNTPNIISKSSLSIVDYIDDLIIIDYSDKNNDCYNECEKLSLENNKITTIHYDDNLGHGPGLNKGIEKLNNEYIICMDSDCFLINSDIIDIMKNNFIDEKIYGVGRILKLQNNQINYLYLPFCMIKKEVFLKYPPFIHDGAPFIKTMKSIKGKMKLIDIPNFMNYIIHDGRSTRKIAGNWRRGFGGKDGI